MNAPLGWMQGLGQLLLYAAFAAFIGVFSHWPRYQVLPPGQAVVKVSFIHFGERAQPCRQRSAEELAKLPPNMRAPSQCARERVPVTIEVEVDGRPVYRQVAQPAGLSRDGASAVYHRFALPAGAHRFTVRLRDQPGDAFNHVREATVQLAPSQVLVIDFDATRGVLTLT